MTSRVTAAIAAAFLAIGVLVGAAGAVLVREATTPDSYDRAGGSGWMAMMSGAGMMGGDSWLRHHAAHHSFSTGTPR